MKSIPLSIAAQRIGKHRSTLSKWLKKGAPCVEEGQSGRGHTSMVDVDALMRWRAGELAPGLAQRKDNDILKLMETALLDTLKRDDLARRARITDAQAGLVVLLVYERAFRNLKEQPLTPQHVPEQMRQLCTVLLDSAERGQFHRRSQNELL